MSQHPSLLPVYRRCDTMMVRGEGVMLFDSEGKKYLDFAAGIATNALGHNHPALLHALHAQADRLWHCSNLFRNAPLEAFADALTQAAGMDYVFFGSSGTEAVECAIKMIRRHHYVAGNAQRTEIIAMDGAFHGRSTGALAACSKAESKEGFAPLMPGFSHAPFHDIDALAQMVTERTAAIMLEPIQGEGGVRVHDNDYLRAVRALCDTHGILLFVDEIQCGYGRTGALFAYHAAGVQADIITCAKGMGGGFPLSAVLSTQHAARGMTQGTHGSTYGSNPLACAVGMAVLDTIMQDGFLRQVQTVGTQLHAALVELADAFPRLFCEVRGRGLMLGLALQPEIDKYALSAALREAGLLVSPAVTHVIRVIPPLIIEQAHIDMAAQILHTVCRTWEETR